MGIRLAKSQQHKLRIVIRPPLQLRKTIRRSEFRRTKRRDRLHLVDGLLVALVDIDEVIAIIRASDNAAQAKERLMERFGLSEIQTQYILDTPLRRLTRFDKPVTLVWGQDDRVFKPSLGRRLAEVFSNGKLIEVPGSSDSSTVATIQPPNRINPGDSNVASPRMLSRMVSQTVSTAMPPNAA